jgi:acetyl-CoA acetyltransferase
LYVKLLHSETSLFLEAETVPVRTVNRQCSSGLQAVADVVAAIKAGFYDIGMSILFFIVIKSSNK